MTEKPKLQTHINTVSQRKHRQQLIWQIILPLVIVVGIVLVFAVFLGYAETEDVSTSADISVIFLVIHVIVLILILLLIIGLGIFGLQKVKKFLPLYTYQAQEIITRVEKSTRRISESSTRPFVRIGGVSAALQALIKNLRFHERE